jgi:hypothetical protein
MAAASIVLSAGEGAAVDEAAGAVNKAADAKTAAPPCDANKMAAALVATLPEAASASAASKVKFPRVVSGPTTPSQPPSVPSRMDKKDGKGALSRGSDQAQLMQQAQSGSVPYHLCAVGHSLGGISLLVHAVTAAAANKPTRLHHLILYAPGGVHEKMPLVSQGLHRPVRFTRFTRSPHKNNTIKQHGSAYNASQRSMVLTDYFLHHPIPGACLSTALFTLVRHLPCFLFSSVLGSTSFTHDNPIVNTTFITPPF